MPLSSIDVVAADDDTLLQSALSGYQNSAAEPGPQQATFGAVIAGAHLTEVLRDIP